MQRSIPIAFFWMETNTIMKCYMIRCSIKLIISVVIAHHNTSKFHMDNHFCAPASFVFTAHIRANENRSVVKWCDHWCRNEFFFLELEEEIFPKNHKWIQFITVQVLYQFYFRNIFSANTASARINWIERACVWYWCLWYTATSTSTFPYVFVYRMQSRSACSVLYAAQCECEAHENNHCI